MSMKTRNFVEEIRPVEKPAEKSPLEHPVAGPKIIDFTRLVGFVVRRWYLIWGRN